MKTFYSDMVTHCLKFYVRHRDPKFRSDADKKNWYACENALKSFNETDRTMLIEVYTGGDVMHDCEVETSRRFKVSPDTLWSKVHELERKVAKRRGLI